MKIEQLSRINQNGSLYTVIDVLPENDSPIIIPNTSFEEKILELLMHIVPNYFDSNYKEISAAWKLECDDTQSKVKLYDEDTQIYSTFNVRFYKKITEFENIGLALLGIDRKDFLKRSDLDKESIPADIVKRILFKHNLEGYKSDGPINFRPTLSHSVVRDDMLYRQEGQLINLNTFRMSDRLCDFAYETIFTSIITSEDVKNVLHHDIVPINVDFVDKYARVSHLENPTLDNVRVATREYRRFLDYFTENKIEITTITNQLYSTLVEGASNEGIKLCADGLAPGRIDSVYARRLSDTIKSINHQIAKLPKFESDLAEYIHRDESVISLSDFLPKPL